MKHPISVLLVEDHALIRDTLSERLASEPDLSVVGIAGNANEAIDQCLEHKPDVVLSDIDMPGLSCFDAARTIQLRCPHTRILFLSSYCHDHYIAEALAAGASGYITKAESYETMVRAIRTVAAGDAYFSPEVQSRIVVESRGARLSSKRRTRCSTLTARESEILSYVAQGMSKKEIAALLHISPNTVDVHTSKLMAKLDIHDRVQLTRFAIREGLAQP